MTDLCGKPIVAYENGEYEGECELSVGHSGDHFDGVSWYDEDENFTDYDHRDEPRPTPWPTPPVPPNPGAA